VTRADFDFQNANGVGPSAIESVVAYRGDTVVLRLNDAVDPADIGSDVISARAGQLADVDGENARTVDTTAVALNDTTAPTLKPGQIDAGRVTRSNQDSYVVTVDSTIEPTDVAVEARGASGTTLTNTTASATGPLSLTFDASAFADGPVAINVTLTDAGGNAVVRTVTVEKDTVAPTLSVAAANAGSDRNVDGKTRTVTAVFSESVAISTVSADAFNLTNPGYAVDDAAPTANANEVRLTLNRSVAPRAIGNASVVTLEAPGITDDHGYAVGNAVALTDEDAGGPRAPSHRPTVASVAVQSGDANVTLTYDEVVRAGDGSALTAANFSYVDANDGRASAVSSVTQTGPQTVVVTVDEALNASDLANDQLHVAGGEVVDVAGNAQAETSLAFGIDTGLTVDARTTDDDHVTVQVTSVSDVSTALSGELTVTELNRELSTIEGFGLEDRFRTTVSASDFTEVRPGVYRATVELPDDGTFEVAGVVDGTPSATRTIVNTERPSPTDAVVLGVSSAAQLDDERNTTRLRVLFSEPVDASEVVPGDVSIDGFDGNVVAVQDAGAFGAV
jgi:hypothetical protein